MDRQAGGELRCDFFAAGPFRDRKWFDWRRVLGSDESDHILSPFDGLMGD
jgi:hypothetical protein